MTEFTRRRSTLIVLAGCSLLGCSLFARPGEMRRTGDDPIGTPLVTGTDTSFLVAAPSYELLSPTYGALWDTKYVVDGVAILFRRLFGEEPPKIAIVLRDSVAGRPSAPADDQRLHGLPTAVVALAAHRADARDEDHAFRAMALARRLATVAAREWVAAYARAKGDSASNAFAARAVGRDSAGSTRLPAWLEVAAVTMLSMPGAEDALVAQVRERVRDVAPLASLFTAEGPRSPLDMPVAGPDEIAAMPAERRAPPARLPRGSARGDDRSVEERRRSLFIAQATSVLLFLSERAGTTFVASMARSLLAGADMAVVLRSYGGTPSVPPTVEQLEAEWRRWLGSQRMEYGERRRSGAR